MKYIASGAKGVTINVPAKSMVYLPDILDLKNKAIKYIDVCNSILSIDRNGNNVDYNVDNCYISLMEVGSQNLFYKDVNLTTIDPFSKLGMRSLIDKKIDLVNSYITNQGNNNINIFIVFWYDEPQVMRPYYEDQVNNVDYIEVKKFNTVENRLYLPESRTLINKEIVNLTFIPDTLISPSNNTTVGYSQYKVGFLTLQRNNFMFVENVPLFLFSDNEVCFRMQLQNVQFDFINSYIDIPSSQASAMNGKCFFANVEYRRE